MFLWSILVPCTVVLQDDLYSPFHFFFLPFQYFLHHTLYKDLKGLYNLYYITKLLCPRLKNQTQDNRSLNSWLCVCLCVCVNICVLAIHGGI